MEFLIITGLSGAGKSRAADILEDLEYYCVDNLPAALMTRFAELCIATQGRYEKVALVADIRERDCFNELLKKIEELKTMNCKFHILYMDADVPTLVQRYKESRRPHPLADPGVTVEQAIEKEITQLAPIKEKADYIVNSSNLTISMLQNRLFALFGGDGKAGDIEVSVVSFDYKRGIPMDADLVFDARLLPNPSYVEDLRPLTGLDRPVGEYVFGYQQTRSFVEKIESLLDFMIPLYIEEGKLGLTVAVGCTGGRHRSVAVAAAINDYLVAKGIHSVNINRDLNK